MSNTRLLCLIQILFVLLKITGCVSWPWVWVMVPLWIMAAAFVLLVGITMLIAAFIVIAAAGDTLGRRLR